MFSPAKAITTGALVFALGGVVLIAQPFDQPGSGVPGAAAENEALRPALVTGTMTYDEDDSEFTCLSGPWSGCVERPSADGIPRVLIAGVTASVEMSDARLSGNATWDERSDGFGHIATLPDVPGLNIAYFEEEGVAVRWGTVRIENEAGTWEGTWIDTVTIAGPVGPMDLLVGTGAYDGLSAILYEGITDNGDDDTAEYSLDGVIFPGDLPPDRE